MCFMFPWQRLWDELHGIRQFPFLAVLLVLLAVVLSWKMSQWMSKNRIATMQERMATIQSENNLLKSQSAVTADWQGPLPVYSFGGSDTLVYNNPDWNTQVTARPVLLDWGRMADIDAYAVLRMSADGESAWVQGRIDTDGEVVAISERHQGGVTVQRLPCRVRSVLRPTRCGSVGRTPDWSATLNWFRSHADHGDSRSGRKTPDTRSGDFIELNGPNGDRSDLRAVFRMDVAIQVTAFCGFSEETRPLCGRPPHYLSH